MLRKAILRAGPGATKTTKRSRTTGATTRKPTTGRRATEQNITLETLEPRVLFSTVSFAATHDATIRGGAFSDNNYGSDVQVRLKESSFASSDRAALITFNLSDLDAVQDAKLRLFGGLDATDSVSVSVREAEGGWSESSVTWNNAPGATSGILDTTTVNSTTDRWWEWDVTDLLQDKAAGGASSVSFMIRADRATTASQSADFTSSEAAANRPQLVVTEGTVTSPTNPAPLAPSHDSKIRGGAFASVNYNGSDLRVKNSPTVENDRVTLIKFDVGNLGSFGSARLRLYGEGGGSGSVNVSVFESGTSWSESSVTWNNAPSISSTRLATRSVNAGAAGWYEWDLTAFLKAKVAAGATQVSIALQADAHLESTLDFVNGEASGNRPQLVFGTASPTPTPIPQDPAPTPTGNDHAVPAWVNQVKVVRFDPSRSLAAQIMEQTGPVKFIMPAGTFRLTQTGTINTNKFAFIGAGRGLTIIECDASGLNVNARSSREDIYIEGVSFTMPTRTYGHARFSMEQAENNRSNGLAIFGGVNRLTINNCSFSRFSNGIVLDPQDGRTVNRVRIFGTESSNNYYIPGSTFGQGIYAANTHDIVVANSTFARNGKAGIPNWADGTIFVHGAYISVTSRNALFLNSKFISNAADGIQLRPGGGSLIYNGVRRTGGVINCDFIDGGHGVWFGPDPTIISRNVFRGNAWNIGIGGATADRACVDALVEHNVVYASRPLAHRGVEGIRSSGLGNRIRLIGNVVAVESRRIVIRSGDTLLQNTGNISDATDAQVQAKLNEIRD